MPAFTVYNFGTNSHTGDKTITAVLANATNDRTKFVTQGVGSGGAMSRSWKTAFLKKTRTNPGNTTALTGLISGCGTDANVAASLQAIDDAIINRNPYLPAAFDRVNLCGWSRGAVTCFKVANALNRLAPNLPVYIFAFDPVPGSNWSSRHMWASIAPTPNVRKCVIIVARHEVRKEFAPALPDAADPDHAQYVVDTMPGDHSTILTLDKDRVEKGTEAGYYINLDRCAKFLEKHGTLLTYKTRLSDPQLVRAYSQVLQNWKGYASTEDWKRRSGRTLKNFDRTKKPGKLGAESGLGSDFFVNEHHHKKVFRKVFPNTYHELTKGPAAFQRVGPWFPEVQGMLNGTDDVTGSVVLQHMELVNPATFAAVLQRL